MNGFVMFLVIYPNKPREEFLVLYIQLNGMVSSVIISSSQP